MANFNELKTGDLVLSLEMNRRMLCPIFEVCKVLKIGKEYTGRMSDDKFSRLIKLELVDSTNNSYEVVLEAETNSSIFDKVYYTTSPEAVYNEVAIQKQKALAVLQNRKKYEACVEECDNILKRLSPESPKENAQQVQATEANIKNIIREEVGTILEPTMQKIDILYNSLTNKVESENQ